MVLKVGRPLDPILHKRERWRCFGCSGFAAFRAVRLCLTELLSLVRGYASSRLPRRSLNALVGAYGKAQPYRTEGGKAAYDFHFKASSIEATEMGW
jgi:hypothetical protein